MEPIIINFHQFPEEIKLSEERRAKYFDQKDELPLKYMLDRGSSLDPRYIWKTKNTKTCLYDTASKDWVVKNSRAVGTPKYVSIAGNDIMRMFEHTRNRIVNTLKDYFLEGIGTPIGLDDKGKKIYEPGYDITRWPVNIYMEIHTFPHYMNWDLDNLWIYNKCFQDAMKECGMIPDDNIQYITSSAAPRFIPVSREEDRLMKFVISAETDQRILGYILYWSIGKKFKLVWPPDYKSVDGNFGDILISTDYHVGKPGDIMIEPKKTALGYLGWINIGTNKLVQVSKALERIRHQCYQLNCVPVFTKDDYMLISAAISHVFMNKGIPVKVLEHGS